MVSRSNIGSNTKVTKLQIFNKIAGKVSGFIIVCKLFLRIRMREIAVEEQIQ